MFNIIRKDIAKTKRCDLTFPVWSGRSDSSSSIVGVALVHLLCSCLFLTPCTSIFRLSTSSTFSIEMVVSGSFCNVCGQDNKYFNIPKHDYAVDQVRHDLVFLSNQQMHDPDFN